MVLKEVFAEIVETQLITIFKVTVIWCMLLNGVIGKMDPIVGEGGCVSCIRGGTCSYIAFAEKVAILVVRY